MKYLLSIILLCSLALFSGCEEMKEVTFSGVEQVKILSISKSGIEAEITTKINNPNKMAFTIYKSNMDVSISGIDVGRAALTEKVKIKGNSNEAYTFRIKSDFSKLTFKDLPKALSIAMNRRLKVGLKGDLRVGKLFIKKRIAVDMEKVVPVAGM